MRRSSLCRLAFGILTVASSIGLTTTTANAATSTYAAVSLVYPATADIPAQGSVIALENVYSSKCLDDYAFSTADGNQMVQWTCDGYDNQKWIVEDAGGGAIYLKNKYSGKCLDDYAFSTADGNAMVQWHCDGYSNQKWFIALDSNPGFLFQNAYSGKFLDDYGFSTANGNVIRQYHYDGYSNQHWGLILY